MRDDVLAIVTHDLRNPLSSIVVNADQLLRVPEKITPERVQKNARTIRAAGERMSGLIDDLLEVARIDSGSLSLDLSRTRVDALVSDALALFEAPASERSISLTTTPLPDVALLCDRERLLQVLSNLIGNALKFSSDGSSIIVRAEVRSGALVFSVSDQAGGIEPDHVDYVFERHWQAPEAHRKGSGLGLYIAKGLVEAHGGAPSP
jgi:signal transduction histidine kinase